MAGGAWPGRGQTVVLLGEGDCDSLHILAGDTPLRRLLHVLDIAKEILFRAAAWCALATGHSFVCSFSLRVETTLRNSFRQGLACLLDYFAATGKQRRSPVDSSKQGVAGRDAIVHRLAEASRTPNDANRLLSDTVVPATKSSY